MPIIYEIIIEIIHYSTTQITKLLKKVLGQYTVSLRISGGDGEASNRSCENEIVNTSRTHVCLSGLTHGTNLLQLIHRYVEGEIIKYFEIFKYIHIYINT